MLQALLLLTALLPAAVHDVPAPVSSPVRGVLILAHGGQPSWNDRVKALAEVIDARVPAEIAFGMAQRFAIQAAVDRLVARGVSEIVAVPLFVSPHSSVVTSTEYLLGARREMPADLRLFARTSHAGHGAEPGAAGHSAVPSADPTSPVASPVPVRVTPALGRHVIVADILASRARSLSRDASREAVVLVAHGPVGAEENAKWIADLESLAGAVRRTAPYASIVPLTVRDDAPPAIRDQATAELRAAVERETGLGRRVLIVPVLMSFGGIEAGIHKRLAGLDYVMADQGLMPDDRIERWVLEMAGVTSYE
jgi:sirohydrochlorin ferrochelatase